MNIINLSMRVIQDLSFVLKLPHTLYEIKKKKQLNASKMNMILKKKHVPKIL